MDPTSFELFFAAGKIFNLEIGDPYNGGYYAGDIFYNNNYYRIIVAPKSSGQTTASLQNPITTSISRRLTDGYGSTQDYYNTGNSAAANFVVGLSIGGYTDWYIPARDEINLLYSSFKPTTDASSSGSVTQTTVTIFQAGGSEAFDTDDLYWSSTSNSATQAGAKDFTNGSTSQYELESDTNYVRAIRKELI